MEALIEWEKARENQSSQFKIDVTDDTIVQFNAKDEEVVFTLVVKNRSNHLLLIERVDVTSKFITLQNELVTGTEIGSDGTFNLIFSVKRDETKQQDRAMVHIVFHHVTISRTVQIYFEPNAFTRNNSRWIQQQRYDCPRELANIINSNRSKEQIKNDLDELIPAAEHLNWDNYANFWHNLLWIEELGLLKCFKIYTQPQNYFKKKNGKFEMKMENLFETRPSLKIGDLVAATKVIDPGQVYEGMIHDLKDDTVIVKFSSTFSETFNSEGYYVRFFLNRSPYIHQHRAIDMAPQLLDPYFLFPMELVESTDLQMDIELNEDLEIVKSGEIEPLPWFNYDLNEIQKIAVVNVLKGKCSSVPYIIYGPPGTGKTTTLTEIALQIHKNVSNSRILIATQSNSAANLIAQRLIKSGNMQPDEFLRLTSFSHARSNKMQEDLLKYSATVKRVSQKKDNDDLFDNNLSLSIRTETNIDFIKSYRLIVGSNLALYSLVSSAKLNYSFTHILIDEAGQCTEIEALIPILLVGKNGQTIMAGDPMQMPPVLFDKIARDRGLKTSMMARLLRRYSSFNQDSSMNESIKFDPRISTKLIYNYRSLPCILNFVNIHFYGSELRATVCPTTSEEAKTLNFLMQGAVPENGNGYGIYFFDIKGKCWHCQTTSWCNRYEALEIQKLVEKLMALGINPKDIGIISPYFLQVQMIKHQMEILNADVTVGTVEEFQGQEKLVIILSTVRTRRNQLELDVVRRLGFVQCPKRLNVAVSRARALFIVCGDAQLLQSDEKWKSLIDGCKDNGTFIEVDVTEHN